MRMQSWLLTCVGCIVFTLGVCNSFSAQIRLGFFPNITHAQALYAKATRYLETNGVEVKWQAFNAGPTAIEALFSDAIDATYIGPSPTINGYVKSHGEKFVIISGAASGGSALVVRNDSGINAVTDFNGKTLATPQLGNTQDVAARIWLLENHLRPKIQGGTVDLIPLSNPDQVTMFKTKQIDAAWTVEPWVSRLELEAKGKIFLEEKTLWPEGKYVTTQLVVTRKFLKEQPDVVRKLLTAHVELTQLINSNKTKAAMVLNEQIRKETSRALREEVITRALDRVELTWDPIASSLAKQAQAAHEIHFLRQKPDLAGIYELGLLNEVLHQKNLPPVSETPK
ncbi:MAG: transporter, substrate-binding protein [Verrucomicrobiales bacterium]|nr:transporter, substrate-binding protein [Verrucomicrobiales bacterium]